MTHWCLLTRYQPSAPLSCTAQASVSAYLLSDFIIKTASFSIFYIIPNCICPATVHFSWHSFIITLLNFATPINCTFHFFTYIFFQVLCFFLYFFSVPQRRARDTVPSQVAIHLGTDTVSWGLGRYRTVQYFFLPSGELYQLHIPVYCLQCTCNLYTQFYTVFLED